MTDLPSKRRASSRVPERARRLARRVWSEWVRPYALLLALVAPLKSAVLDWNWVPSGSMKPTILEGELVLVNKLAYDLKVPFTTRHLAEWSAPRRGDIAVFFSPADGTRLVKRVVGLPGDIVQLRAGRLHINGVVQQYASTDAGPFRRDIFEDDEPVIAVEQLGSCPHYVLALPHRPVRRDFGPYVVGADEYFMMGDSRDNSFDSRFFGPVPRKNVIGRAGAVLLSFDPSRYLLPRPGRFARSLSAPDA